MGKFKFLADVARIVRLFFLILFLILFNFIFNFEKKLRRLFIFLYFI